MNEKEVTLSTPVRCRIRPVVEHYRVTKAGLIAYSMYGLGNGASMGSGHAIPQAAIETRLSEFCGRTVVGDGGQPSALILTTG
jgi:hypothetical protein